MIAERDVARRRANELLLTQARGALERDATEALMWLRTYPTDGEDWAEVRRLAIEAEARGVARHVRRATGSSRSRRTAARGSAAATASALELHDAATGALVGQVPHRGRPAEILASPDGRTLVLRNRGDTCSRCSICRPGARAGCPTTPP